MNPTPSQVEGFAGFLDRRLNRGYDFPPERPERLRLRFVIKGDQMAVGSAWIWLHDTLLDAAMPEARLADADGEIEVDRLRVRVWPSTWAETTQAEMERLFRPWRKTWEEAGYRVSVMTSR